MACVCLDMNSEHDTQIHNSHWHTVAVRLGPLGTHVCNVTCE